MVFDDLNIDIDYHIILWDVRIDPYSHCNIFLGFYDFWISKLEKVQLNRNNQNMFHCLVPLEGNESNRTQKKLKQKPSKISEKTSLIFDYFCTDIRL